MKTWNEENKESGGGGDGDSGTMVGKVMNTGAGTKDQAPKLQTFTGTGISLGGEPR